jgi:tyrosine-specific transport protein
MKPYNRLVGGILLVSGTTIGAGMLALPVVTGLAGLLPTLVLFITYWSYMTFTALLLLEVNLWMGGNVNLITMARRTLGRWGEIVSWITYLFLLYLLTSAYLAGGGPILNEFIRTFSGISLPNWAGPLPLFILFGIFIYKGTKSVDYANRYLMAGLVLAYLAMVVFLFPRIEISLLKHVNWDASLLGVSLIATSFGFHIIIPTLTTYLNRDFKLLKKAILIGSFIPLIVYVVWEIITLGIIPLEGPSGILQGYERGNNGVFLLSTILGNSWISLISQFFSFFAIVTSFLGVTLSLSDFLTDGLHIKKTSGGRLLSFILTFLPPLIFIYTYPRAFLSALEFAGAFGVVILLGLLPTLMVWSGRYRKKYDAEFRVPGGKISLIISGIFSLVVIAIEVANKTGLLDLLYK